MFVYWKNIFLLQKLFGNFFLTFWSIEKQKVHTHCFFLKKIILFYVSTLFGNLFEFLLKHVKTQKMLNFLFNFFFVFVQTFFFTKKTKISASTCFKKDCLSLWPSSPPQTSGKVNGASAREQNNWSHVVDFREGQRRRQREIEKTKTHCCWHPGRSTAQVPKGGGGGN